jgi:hypothetical protein
VNLRSPLKRLLQVKRPEQTALAADHPQHHQTPAPCCVSQDGR